MKTTSHGVLILAESAELLLCHATGGRHWDIPKGMAAEGESSAAAAIREAREECGLELDAGGLHPVGHFAYRRDKDLALHAVLSARIDTASCVCSSVFVDRFGRVRPEMDAFGWTPFADVGVRCAKSMALVLTAQVSLPALLDRLLCDAGRRDASRQARAPTQRGRARR